MSESPQVSFFRPVLPARPGHERMDHPRAVRPGRRCAPPSGVHFSPAACTSLSSATPESAAANRGQAAAAAEAESSGDPDSPGSRPSPSPASKAGQRSEGGDRTASGLVFDQPLDIIGGFLIGLLTLVVPLTGVVMDRRLLPSRVEAGQQPFRPVAAAENPENPGPGRKAPDH